MKKQILSFALVLYAAIGFTQISFEKGYFINSQNERTECLIRNIDWSNNPINITYKITENDKSEEFSIEQVKEFGVYNYSTYRRYILPIDKSGSTMSLLSYQRAPEWDIDTVFLKIEVEGVATLYSYKKSSLKRYFYSIDDSDPQQLICKKYKTESGSTVINNSFQNQLYTDVKIENMSVKEVAMVEYTLNDLRKYFMQFNESKGLTYSKHKNKKSPINLFAKGGMSLTSLSVSNSVSDPDDPRNVDFGSAYSYRVGFDAEYYLPFNKGKWAIFVEPAYSTYHFEKEYKTYYDWGKVTAEINSIEIGLGVRYYVFLSEKSKIYLGASLQYDINFNSIIDYSDNRDLEIKESAISFVGLGLGYNYNNFFIIEVKRMPNRGLLVEYGYWSEEFSCYSINAGVNLLKIKDWF